MCCLKKSKDSGFLHREKIEAGEILKTTMSIQLREYFLYIHQAMGEALLPFAKTLAGLRRFWFFQNSVHSRFFCGYMSIENRYLT